MSQKFVRLICLFCMLTLSACVSGKNDKLGLVDNEAVVSYADAYAPARSMLNSGNFAEIQAKMALNPVNSEGEPLSNEEMKDFMLDKYSELAMLERGLLTLNSGDYERALIYFDIAENKLNLEGGEGGAAAKQGMAVLLGAEEMSEYALRGYEKVMLFNYKALSYMLKGDRRAYNVTRKAIDQQQEEWELFQAQLAELQSSHNYDSNTQDMVSDKVNNSADSDVKALAALVPNAYVNPFGDYMDAMIMEIDSLKDSSLRGNASIAYKKVLKNNRDCVAAKQALKDLSKSPKNLNKVKLVHVLLADGFSPQFVEKSLAFPVGDNANVFVNYAEAETVPSNITRATVNYGKNWRSLSSLTKMESLILRDYEDKAPFRVAMFTAAILRQVAASSAGGEWGGLISGVLSLIQHPDTRSWLTLPNKIMTARMYVPVNTKQIVLRTYDKKKRTVAKTIVPLAAKGPTVVYAVSYDKFLKAYANSCSWVK